MPKGLRHCGAVAGARRFLSVVPMDNTAAGDVDRLLTRPIMPLGSLSWCLELPPVLPGHDLPALRQPCAESPEPLVKVVDPPVLDAYRILGILPQRRMMLRAEVAARLLDAHKALPEPLGLVVLDAWRTVAEQAALVAHYGDAAADDGFVASVSDDGPRPPHTTGGAVDLTLAWNGVPLALGTEYDSFDVAASVDHFEGDDTNVDPRIRLLRRCLTKVMTDAGFASYGKEWWHWSLGDDVWAAANESPALYDITSG